MWGISDLTGFQFRREIKLPSLRRTWTGIELLSCIDCHATCSLKQNSSLCDRARCGYGCTFGLCFFGKVVSSRVTWSFKGISTLAQTCLWNWLVMMSITMSASLCIVTVLHVVSSFETVKTVTSLECLFDLSIVRTLYRMLNNAPHYNWHI